MKPCNKKEIEEEFLEIGMIHNSHKIVLQRLLRPHYDFTIINSDEHENCRPNNNWRMCIYINQEEGGLSEIWVVWKEREMHIRQSLSPDSCMCKYVNYYLDGREGPITRIAVGLWTREQQHEARFKIHARVESKPLTTIRKNWQKWRFRCLLFISYYLRQAPNSIQKICACVCLP